MALVLLSDAEERVWVIAEVCSNCAEAMPRAKVIKGGRTLPPTTSASPQLPVAASAMETKSTAIAEAKTAERNLALNCRICTAEAAPASQTSPEAPSADECRPVPIGYGHAAVETLRYLDFMQAGHSPEARLLALLITLRLRKDGTFFMRSCDLSSARLSLSPAALEELIECGWADAPLEEVLATGPGEKSVACRVPEFSGGLEHLGISSASRSHINAWALQVALHPALVDHPAGIRLGAFYVTAHSNVTGPTVIHPRHMARFSRYTSRDLVPPVLESLKEAQWLHSVQPGPRPGDPVRVTLTRHGRRFAPGFVPTPSPASMNPRLNSLDTRGRGYEIAAWTDAYVARHHHGPRHRELLAAHFDENPQAPWTEQAIMGTVRRLTDDGWLRTDGTRWYRTRPGMTYLRRLAREQEQMANPAEAKHRRVTPQRQPAHTTPAKPPACGSSPVPKRCWGRNLDNYTAGRWEPRELLIQGTRVAL